MANGRAVAILLSGTQTAQPLCGGGTQSLVKILDHQHIHRPSSLAGIGIECILIAHCIQRFTEQHQTFPFYVDHAAAAFELAAGRSTHIDQERDRDIALFFFSPDVDPIARLRSPAACSAALRTTASRSRSSPSACPARRRKAGGRKLSKNRRSDLMSLRCVVNMADTDSSEPLSARRSRTRHQFTR